MRVFEIRDLGALPFVVSTAVVAIVATVASFFPGWRATRLSPMVAIRNEPASMWQSTRQTLRQTLTRLSQAVSLADEGPRELDADLLTEFVAAARGRDVVCRSFRARARDAPRPARRQLGGVARTRWLTRTCRSSRFPTRQTLRLSLPAGRLSREPRQVLQLSAAVHDCRSRELAALGARAPAETRRRRFRHCSTSRRAAGRAAASQGRHPRHPAARPEDVVARRTARLKSSCCGSVPSN